jgi:subtilase family serine protease
MMNLARLQQGIAVAACVMAGAFQPSSAFAQSVTTNGPVRRVTTSVDARDVVPVASSIKPWVRHASDLGQAPSSTAAPRMLLLLQRDSAGQQSLSEFLADVQNPASPSYHHWLTPSQFAEQFGVNSEDIASVTTWLQSQGLSVTRVSPGRNIVEFSGTVGQLQQAFGTQIHRLSAQGKVTLANVTELQIPRALAPVISGLVNLGIPSPRPNIHLGPTAKFDSATHSIKPDFTLFNSSGTPYLYVDPADAAVMYDTPNKALNPKYSGTTLDGTGVTVGIVGDSNVNLAPVANYRTAFLGETAGATNLPTVVVDGNDPGINGDEVESFLDMEVLGGIAPKANILYYTSDDSDLSAGLFNAILRAVDDNNVSILNVSFSGCEPNQGTAGNAFVSEVYQQAAAQGITITVSSGDSGSANCDSSGATTAANGLAVNALGSTPYNVSVGGTDYDALATDFNTYVQSTQNGESYSGAPPYWLTALSYIPEKPWNDSTNANNDLADNTPFNYGGSTDIIAGGGGVSQVYAKPSFQTALTPKDGARDLPDVSFLAGNGLYGAVWVLCGNGGTSGYDCQNTNGQFISGATFSGAGGTSAAAPAFAGMLALVEQSVGSRLGQANNVLYQLAASKYASVFHDISSGNISVVCTSGSSGCGSNGFMTGYDAGTGYDLASGLGSVDAAAMVNNWKSVASSSSTISLTIDGSTAPVSVTHGTPLTFNVAVNPATASGTAALITTSTLPSSTGQLAIPVTDGSGSATYNGLPGGSYTVYARYGGDTTNAASSSTPITLNIASEASTTQLAINAYNLTNGQTYSSLSALPYGSYIFADANIVGTAESTSTQGLATGSLNILDSGKQIGTATISSDDLASFPALAQVIYPYAVGSHTVTAVYPGDASFKGSTSNAVTFSIVKGSTSVALTPASTLLNPGSTDVIAIAINTQSLAIGPSGTVTLTANGVTLGTSSTLFQDYTNNGLGISLVNFTIQASQLQPGANTLTATFSGDTNYSGSVGTTVVNLTQSGFSLTTSPISVTAGVASGNTATLRLTPNNGFIGQVNLSCAVTIAPANATSPVTCTVPASLNITGTSAVTGTLTANTATNTSNGTYVITVTGKDAATGTITTSTTSTVTVTGSQSTGSGTFALTNSGNLTIAPGASSGNTATVTVTPSGGFTGAVNLACSVTTVPTGAVDPVTCALSSSSVSITGATAATATLTVSSTAATTAALEHRLERFGAPILAFTFLLWIPARKRRRFRSLLSLLCICAAIGVVTGCGGSGSTKTKPPTNPGTTAGAYTITVTGTGTSGSPQTTAVTVTVN